MSLIIGISGKIGSGKDYITDFITEKIAKQYDIIADKRKFADKVKEITAAVTSMPLQYMYDQEKKNVYLPIFDKTIGEMQQIIGTEIFRTYDKNFWIKTTLHDINDCGLVILSDTRFKNEANFIKEHGGILIRIEGDPLGIRKKSKRDLNHSSETDLDDYDGFDIIYQNEKDSPLILNLWDELNKILAKKIKYVK